MRFNKDSDEEVTFAERCAAFGRTPQETGLEGLRALELGLDYDSSKHTIACSNLGLNPKVTSINYVIFLQHGLPEDTTPHQFEQLTGKKLRETSIQV